MTSCALALSSPLKVCRPVLDHVGRGEDGERRQFGHMDVFVLDPVGRAEDDERLELGHVDLLFHLINFPDAFAFLFHLGLQYVPGSSFSILCWLPACSSAPVASLEVLCSAECCLPLRRQKPANRFCFHCWDH